MPDASGCLPALVLRASSALRAAARRRRAIVNGTTAAQGEYPAQGFLGINTDGDRRRSTRSAAARWSARASS